MFYANIFYKNDNKSSYMMIGLLLAKCSLTETFQWSTTNIATVTSHNHFKQAKASSALNETIK